LQKRQGAVVEMLLVWFAVGSAPCNAIVVLISVLQSTLLYSAIQWTDLDFRC
jgi:hypothetical protein